MPSTSARAQAQLAQASPGASVAVHCDVSDPGQVDAMVARVDASWGRIDALVNNAGVAVFKPLVQTSFEEWRTVMATNLDGAYLCSQAVVPVMRRHGAGAIVNIASISGLRASTLRVAYGTSKAALIHFTKQQAVELAGLGIRTNGEMQQLNRPQSQLSQKLQGVEIPETLLAVARAGAGVNNVPVAEYSKHGIVVFNTPGANANAVKELVMAGMLLATRGILPGLAYVQSLTSMTDAAEMAQLLEKEKSRFAGGEIKGKTLGTFQLDTLEVMPYDYLKKHGIAFKDVKVRYMGNTPEAVEAFKAGAIDWICTIEPYASALVADVKGAVMLTNGIDLYGKGYTDCVLAARSSLIKENPAGLKAIIKGMMQAQLDAETQTEAVLKELVGKYYKTSMDNAKIAQGKQPAVVDARSQTDFILQRTDSVMEMGYIKKKPGRDAIDWTMLEAVIKENPDLYGKLKYKSA